MLYPLSYGGDATSLGVIRFARSHAIPKPARRGQTRPRIHTFVQQAALDG